MTDPVYDAFVSYSHAADDLLAPRLQAGLQRFAKPWWRRRALRIFRDESSLSASPHLWGSITQAMDDSAWFVLLLSPDAASSPWVNREIEWWVAHKDPGRIIPVLTAGDFGWEHGRLTGNAVPESLREVFSEEPRWVDLRFARDDEQLDLQNPTFSAAVADIASTLRGIPKDELESEEVRQHRRTIRTAWAAGVLLVALAITASVLAVVSVTERNRANLQAGRAETEAERAQQEADRANAEAARADEEANVARQNEEIARRNELLARARELAVYSANTLEEDPELSMLLALEAASLTAEAGRSPYPETIRALQAATQVSRLELRLDGGWGRVSFSDDGGLFATDSADTTNRPSGTVLVREAANGSKVAELAGSKPVMSLAFRPESRLLAVGYGHLYEDLDSVPPSDPGTIVIWDPSTGLELARLGGPTHIQSSGGFIERPMAWSPDGSLLAAVSWDGGTDGVVSIWDVGTGELQASISQHADGIVFADQNTLLLAETDPNRVGFYNATTGTETGALDTGDLSADEMALAPDGVNLVLGSQRSTAIELWNLETRSRVWSRFHSTPVIQDVSRDSTMVAVTGFDGIVRLLDLESGDEVIALGGHLGAWGAAFDPTTMRLISVGPGESRMWDVSPEGPGVLGTLSVGPDLPVHVSISPGGDEIAFSTFSGGAFYILDLATGGARYSLVGKAIDFWTPAAISPDWTQVAWVDADLVAWIAQVDGEGTSIRLPPCTSPKAFSPDGAAVLLDGLGLCKGLPTGDLPEGAELRSRVIDVVTGAELLDLGRRAVFARGGGFSPGGALEPGRYVTINNIDQGTVEIWDIPSGSLVASVALAGDTAFSAGVFDPSGRYLPGGSINGRAWVVDLAEVVGGGEIATAMALDVEAHDGTVAGHALSGEGLLATSSFDGSLRLWDVRGGDEPILELSVGLDFASFVVFSPDGQWLYYTDKGDAGFVIRRFPLDPERLVGLAESMVTRSFTADECRRFPSAPSCETAGSDG